MFSAGNLVNTGTVACATPVVSPTNVPDAAMDATNTTPTALRPGRTFIARTPNPRPMDLELSGYVASLPFIPLRLQLDPQRSSSLALALIWNPRTAVRRPLSRVRPWIVSRRTVLSQSRFSPILDAKCSLDHAPRRAAAMTSSPTRVDAALSRRKYA